MWAYSDWSGRRLDAGRVVQILSEASDDHKFGTGYRITDELIITAAHVLVPGDQTRTTVWTHGNPAAAGFEVWRRDDLDLALLHVRAPQRWGRVAPVAWGRIDRATADRGVAFSFIGYPVANALGNRRTKDDRWGVIPPRSYEEAGLYVLNVDGPAPRRPEGGGTLWEGVSGAAVFSSGLLVAIVRSDQTSTEPGQLLAAPIENAVADAMFRQLVGISTLAPLAGSPIAAPREVPVEVVLCSLPTQNADDVAKAKQLLEGQGVAVRSLGDDLQDNDILAWATQADSSGALAVAVLGENSSHGLISQAVGNVTARLHSHPTIRVAVLSSTGQLHVEGAAVFPADDVAAFVNWCVTAQLHRDTALAARRDPCFLDPYPLSTTFVGRREERGLLSTWLGARRQPVMVVKAIGGMGKSALAWTWLTVDVLGAAGTGEQPEPSVSAAFNGVFWFSFYRSDASARAFIRSLLGYLRPAEDWSQLPLSDAADQIRSILRNEAVIIVLDGIERELRAYARLDASMLSDKHADGGSDRFARSAADPVVGRLLRLFCDDPTLRCKVLVTTRLVPADLDDDNIPGAARDGCTVEELKSFSPDDSLQLFRNLQIRGTDAEILAACQPYGFHTLTIRLLAGLVVNDLQDPMDIRAARRTVVEPKTAARRMHILADSYDALDEDQRQVLSRISATRTPMAYSLVRQLAEFINVADLDATLSVLITRGLVMFDRTAKTFDVHPIVRNYAYNRLLDRDTVHEQIADVLSEEIEDWDDFDDFEPDASGTEMLAVFVRVQPILVELFYQFVLAGARDEAAELWEEVLGQPLSAIGDYTTALNCLEALCDDEERFRSEVNGAPERASLRAVLADLGLRLGRPRYALAVIERQEADPFSDPDEPDLDVMLRTMKLNVEARAYLLLCMTEHSERALLAVVDLLETVTPEISTEEFTQYRALVLLETRALLHQVYVMDGRVEEAAQQLQLRAASMRSWAAAVTSDGADQLGELIRTASEIFERSIALPAAAHPEQYTAAHREVGDQWRQWLTDWMALTKDMPLDAAQALVIRLQFVGLTQGMLAMGVTFDDDELYEIELILDDAIADARRAGSQLIEGLGLLGLAQVRMSQQRHAEAIRLVIDVRVLAERNELTVLEVSAYTSLARFTASTDPAGARRFLRQAEQAATTEGRTHLLPLLDGTREYLAKAIAG